ncbi:MAG TPA: hypothetical protein V6D06_03090, partial [Trichocoleus sp.]
MKSRYLSTMTPTSTAAAGLGLSASLVCLSASALAQTAAPDVVPAEGLPAAQITVTSPADGPVQPDAALTLREALELVNGTLPLAALSDAERAFVQPAAAGF